MIFHGFIKTDLVNYPGKVAATVFTQGCNFCCPYCHNPQLVECTSVEEYQESEVIDYLKTRKDFLDGLVISGGEPSLHSGLFAFIGLIKTFGFSVKLDTNGSNPDFLEKLLSENLLDYVAMDLKAPLDKYNLFGFTDTDKIRKSMEVLRGSSINYEFRTTCVKELLTLSDLETIRKMIHPSEKWNLNPFNPRITLDKVCASYSSYTNEEIRNLYIAMLH